MQKKGEMPNEAYQETAIEGGEVVRIITDRSKLKGRLAKKFTNDLEYESSFVFEEVKEFIKPQKSTHQ
jgi:hypothetical protein